MHIFTRFFTIDCVFVFWIEKGNIQGFEIIIVVATSIIFF